MADIIKLDPECVILGKYIAANKYALAFSDLKLLRAMPLYSQSSQLIDPAHELAWFTTALKARISDLLSFPSPEGSRRYPEIGRPSLRQHMRHTRKSQSPNHKSHCRDQRERLTVVVTFRCTPSLRTPSLLDRHTFPSRMQAAHFLSFPIVDVRV